MRLGFALLLGVCIVGCHRREDVHAFDRAPDDALGEWLAGAAATTGASAESDEATRLRETMRDPPPGYALAVVGMKNSREHGAIVILTDPARGRFVPLVVGAADGLAIELRLSKQKFEQPMTHDLLDQAIRALGGRVVRAQLDSVDAKNYRASVILVVGERTLALDARPSDAIALAVGNDAPLFVSARLFETEDTHDGEDSVSHANEEKAAEAVPL